MKNIILLAVQGAGKGTIGRIISAKYGYANISIGEVFRNARNDGTERARIIAEYQDKGILVPLDITLELLKERISKQDCQTGYILDGFPRNIEQANAYENILKELGKDIGIVINLTIPNEIIYERLMGRRTCKNCGRIFNIYNENLAPKVENTCDDCQGELYQRSDDTEEAINARVSTYFKETTPLIDYYKEKNILYEIPSLDVNKTVESVEKILEKLGE